MNRTIILLCFAIFGSRCLRAQDTLLTKDGVAVRVKTVLSGLEIPWEWPLRRARPLFY